MTHFIHVQRKSIFSAKSDRDARIRKKQNFVGDRSVESKNTKRSNAFVNRSDRCAEWLNATADHSLIIPTGFSLIICFYCWCFPTTLCQCHGKHRRCITSNYRPRYRFPRQRDMRNRDLYVILFASLSHGDSPG